MTFSRIAILTILATFANAGPLHHKDITKENTCAITCPGKNNNNSKFNYQTGTVYEFSYDAKTVTKMNGASEDSAMINMNAKVEIEPVTKCDLIMRITDASLKDSEGDQNTEAFKEAMMKQPLKFSFQDGQINHVCVMDGESTWTLNIKKGILSAFQNSMDSFNRDQNLTETDVVGTCLSEYKVINNGHKNRVIDKRKNLLGCSDREGYRLAIQSIGYNVPSFVKSLPLMRSEYKCLQIMDVGLKILRSSTCSEEHVFRPFSSGNNGATSNNLQKLTFDKAKKAGQINNDEIDRRTSLLFEHQFDIDSRQQSGSKIEEQLRGLCREDDVRPELPEMMDRLAASMMVLDAGAFTGLYNKITQPNFCQKHPQVLKQRFLDAIPMVGTVASVKAMEEFISKKYVTGNDVDLWLMSLSFMRRPSREMIAAVTPLLDALNLTGNAMLTVSSMASSYCRTRPNCGNDVEISALINKLLKSVNDCNPQNGDASKIVIALRALGNIGHSKDAVSRLSRCFANKDIPAEIRVAAIDAFRRIPCEAEHTDLMGLFRDESEDSELRINAYIGLMKCPSKDILSEVRQVLEKEKSNQVGSFVWSHLTNLMETSDPHMQDIRNIVQDEELKKQFNLDIRKFSRNYEGSFFFDSINTGAKVDSNVIFSQKSFIPRSANLNLTIDLFGHAINFLEFGGRVQGVEKILENFFGPVGVKEPKLKAKTPLNFDKNMESFRSSAFLRVFGNELRYWDEKSLSELQSSLQKLMRMQSLSFSKTMVLLDSRMIIPTCVGLPLNLTMSSTGSISIDAKASLQTGKFQMNVEFKPSASVQVKGEMSVDAHVSRAGLKMVTVAHTSTGARLDIANNKFDLQIPEKKMEIFNLKTDFYIIHRNAERKQKMIVDNVKKHEICTGKLMKQVTGLTFCQIIKFPNASLHNEAPFFPFTGPVVYDLYMMNEDAPNGYQIELFSPKRPYSFYIDTPGSKIQRKMALETDIKNENEIELSFTAPWKKIQFEGVFINRLDLKKLTGNLSVGGKTNLAFSAQLDVKKKDNSLTYTPHLELTILQKKLKCKGSINFKDGTFMMIMDAEGFTADKIALKASSENLPQNIGLMSQLKIGKNEYSIAIHLGRSVTTTGFKYSPSLRVSVHNNDIVEFTSEIIYTQARRASLKFKLKKVFSKIIDFSVDLVRYHSNMKTKFLFVCAVKAPIGYGQIISHTDIKKDLWMNRVTVTYNLGPKYSDRLNFYGMLKEINIAKSRRFITKLNLQSQMRPSLRLQATGELTKNANLLETNVDVQHGRLDKEVENNFRFYSVAKRDLKSFNHIYNCTVTLKYAPQNLDYKMEAKHVQSAKWPFKKFENNVMIQLAPGKVVQTKLSYNIAKVKGLPTYESEVALSYPGRDMKMANKLMQVNKNTYENHFNVQWQKGREATVQSTYTKTGKDIHNIENMLRLPNKKEAKASAMLQVTRGDYKAKVKFSADANSIAKNSILYEAEAKFSNSRGGKQTSSVLSIDASWSPLKKISANIGTVQTDSSVSNKMVLTTPFDSLKTLETEAKYSWNNGKYSSLMNMSWNKKNEFRNEFSITHPGKELELNYLVSSDIEGNKSFLKYAITKTGPKVTAMAEMEMSNSPVFNLMLSHTNTKKERRIEGNLSFNIYGTDGDFKMDHTRYPQKAQTISSGEGNIKLPFDNLKEIGASYNLKHKLRMSSISIGYSSSLKNFKNGKLTAEISRDRLRMLEGKMKFTQMDKLVLSVEASYKGKVNKHNVDINIVDPRGEKITALANIDFSGPRKTSSFKIKSKYINLLSNGAFEYKNGRFIDGDIKIAANGQKLKMSAHYEKDDALHTLSGNLQLPDGRTIDGKFGLKLQRDFSVSLFVDSPDFPSLEGIDINLVYNGDSNSVVTKGYVKVLPYLKQSEFEASISMKDNINLNFMMKTPYGSMRSVKTTVSLQRNLFKSEFELNKNKVMELEASYMFKSIKDFSASLDLKTSHRRIDAVSLFLKHSGDFFNMESVLKAKIGKEMKMFAKISNTPSYNELTLRGEFKDFEDFEFFFNRIGFLNDMQTTMFYKLEEKEQFRAKLFIRGHGAAINTMIKVAEFIDFELKSELDMDNISYTLRTNLDFEQKEIFKIAATYEHLAKLSIKTSFPSYRDELTMTLNGDMKMFNALAKLTHNSKKYELIISNQGYYRKIDAKLITPFFTDMASFIFNGDEETFNAQAKFMHENDQYELVVSNRQHYKQLTITLSTPFSSDQLDIDSEGELSSFKSLLTFTHNKVEYSLKLSVDGYYRNIKAKVMTPNNEAELVFKLDGDIRTFNMEAEFAYDNDRYKLTVSNKDYYKQMSAKLVTPFSNDSIGFVLEGNLNSFNAKLKYMSFKKLYELVIHNSGYYREMEAKLSTPYFRDTLAISVDGKLSDFTVQLKVMHNHNNYQMTVARSLQNRKLSIELTTPSYEGSVDFSLKGNLQSFVLLTKILNNNEKFQLSISTANYYRQINAELLTPYFKESVDFLFNGTLRKFNAQLTLKHNRMVYEVKASNREFYREMNLQLSTPFFSADIRFEGSLQATNLHAKLTVQKATYEFQITTKKYFQISEVKVIIPKHKLVVKSNVFYKKKSTTGDVTAVFDGKKFVLDGTYKDLGRKKIIKADLKTPYFAETLQGSVTGTLRKFNANMKLQHNKDVYEMTAANKNYYDAFDVSIKGSGMSGKFKSEGDLKNFKVFASLKMAAHLYEMTFENQNYLQNVTLEVSTPQTGKCVFNFGLQSNRDHVDAKSKFSHRNNEYKLDFSIDRKTGQYELKVSAPQITGNGHFKGDLQSFSFNANVALKNKNYEIMVSTKNYFRELSAKMATPQFGEQSLSVKINGELSDFSGFIEVKNNNDVYRSDFSLANNEISFSMPKLLQKLQVKFKGTWKNFDFVMKLIDYNGERIEINARNKNFKELKAHATIPQLKDVDLLVKTNGNLRNGEAMMKISYGENMFENKIEISFDGRQASFKLEPHYNIFGRSGKSKLNVDLMFDDQSYKYEFEADIEGTQVNSMASIKISSEVSFLMTLNIPTMDASGMKLRIVSEGFQKTDMMLNLKSPWTGMTKIFYEHNGEMGKSFSTKGYVERDQNRLAGYFLDTNFVNNYSFDFKFEHKNLQDKIEMKSDLKFQGRKTMISLTFKTPFQILKELTFSAEWKMLRDGEAIMEMNVKSPNEEHSLNIGVKNGRFNGWLNVNMDKRNKDKQYQFQTSYKNADQHTDISRSFDIKIIFPGRTVTFDCRFEDTQNSMVRASRISWDDQKIGFELIVQRENEAKLRVITPRRTIELFGKVEVNGNHCSTMGHIMMDINNQSQKIDIKADITTSSDRADIDLTVKFPNQKKGMNLKTSINVPNGNIIFSSRSEFSMDQDPQKTFKMSTKLMSESKGKRDMYTLQMDAGHANTGFAIDMTGRVSRSPEKYNADVEMGYLNLRNERQKFAVRGEMQTISREINLKLEAPSKTIELDGSLRNRNRYMMSLLKKESGKENMEALFKLNPNAKRMNIVFNYDEENPGRMYHIDAEIIDSKTMLKAYRTNKKSDVMEDAAIQVEIKAKSILKSTIRWNPRLLQEFNTFAFEKLTLYGRDMKSFGDSLIQVMNGEISTRFNLVERSFSEDLKAITDYFESEYRIMSTDFKHAVHYMKQMIDQDSFYVKSAMESITNAYDEMWFNFNNNLIKIRHEIQQFNQYLNNRMDEVKTEFDFYYGKYSMQLMNKVNELLENCRRQCDILYERAMKVKSEIVSSIRNYPNKIKELIEKLRQYPNGRKLIDIVMSMYEMINEKKMQAKDHMNTLTNSIYSAHATLNRHISKVRQYPIVDAIMDAINEVYQQVLWSYNYWDVKDNVLGLKNTLYKVGAEKIKEIKDIVTDIGMNTLVFDPKRGEIIVEVRFGAAKYAFNHFMSSAEDVERAVMKLSNMMPNMDFNVWDIYYMMKPSSDLYDNIPPFKAEASLFVGHHITTFDGRHLNYKGTCSYLLARDFVDGNFTVVANFDADRRSKTLKSLSVTTAHNEQLEIFPDNKVFLGGRVVKLPLQLTDATVRRQGNLIVVQSKRGYKVMCDHDNELYTVQVSGWYFNKMAGLFGNYNNEPMDDMLMSNNRYTNDLEQFAESWSVSRQCRSHRNFAPSHMVPENMECARLFLQTHSPYRYCFKQVDPSQFYKICAMQLSSSKATPIELCKITSYYMKKCETKGVHLSTPYMCPII